MLIVPRKINWKSNYSGLDKLETCFDRQHFLNYPKKITYEYNSKGFRDKEWPGDLSEVIWCIGDSFTVGVGQPYEETWPYLLEKKINKKCINLGEDGCSNDTIALRAQEIYKLHQPKLITIMWSYFHRRRLDNTDVLADKNNFNLKDNIENFFINFKIANNLPTKIINLLVPHALIDFNIWSKKIFTNFLKQNYISKKKQLEEILIFEQLDYARDYHHFDFKTSENIVDLIIKTNSFDKIFK